MARRLIPLLALAIILAALVIVPPAGAATTRRAAPVQVRSVASRTVTLGMGYIPSVQFAPFYVADQHGYYRKAGLTVRFSYASSPNLLQLVGSGKVDLAIADGTDTILATASGVPITYVMAQYQRLPVAIFSLTTKNIRHAADLRGKTIGIPGKYGSSYIGLLATLRAAGLRPGDVNIESIGYTQAVSVEQGRVDAAVGYSTNEPVQLQRHGKKVNVIEVGTVTDLVAPGIVAGQSMVAHDPALLRAFVQATLHGLADTIATPRTAFADACRVQGVDTQCRADSAGQYAVLQHTIAFWHSPATRIHGLGYADPAQWRDSTRTMLAIGQLATAPNSATLYTNAFVAGAEKR